MMINLHLAIGDGDIEEIPFDNQADLCEYLENLKSFDCVWVAADDHIEEKGEIIITENHRTVITAIQVGFFTFTKNQNLYVQEYETYEDAYSSVLSMRELSDKGYNRK